MCIVISFEQPSGVKSREFSTDVMYATQQETDIHGIAFGQRLIGGKVEGQSVMDMKTEDRRATPRFRVQFRTTVSGLTQPEGIGTMLDLSTGGCRLEIPFTIAPCLSLELRVHVPGLVWPLMIDGAHVQWVSGQIVGLAFFRIRQAEQQRLDEVITNLREHGNKDDAR